MPICTVGTDEDAARAPCAGLTFAVIVAGALAVLGLVTYWPTGDAPELPPQPNTYVDATVTGVATEGCDDFETGATTSCQVVSARLTSGPDDGDEIEFQVRSTEFSVPELEGDDVVLLDVATSPPEFRYSFSDFQRRMPLLLLVVAFVVVVILRPLPRGAGAAGPGGQWRRAPGIRRAGAAAGLAGTAGGADGSGGHRLHRPVPGAWLQARHHGGAGGNARRVGDHQRAGPADGDRHPPHGPGRQQRPGAAGDRLGLDLRGLLVAGIVVGALGVLDDVTVSQVSIVAAPRRANPGLGWRLLYREAMSVGRDHVASTVNTLVLAYAGASLPLLLFFTQGDQPVERLLTSELIAVEIVRMLVGSIGLVASVPITTALAKLGDGRRPR